MLAWMTQQKVPGVADIVAYQDDSTPWAYYLIPTAPRFRTDANGMPIFKFLKYRFPIDRPGNKKGGGFLICDIAMSTTDATVKAAKEALQAQFNAQHPNWNPKPQVEIRQVTFTHGTAGIQLLDSGATNAAMVERVQNPGVPSLYGDMILPITAELSPEGATLLEQALQDKGGVVQVFYDLYAPVKMPPMVVTVWFRSEKFMSFHQQVDIDWSFWGDDSYRETIRQQFISSDVGGVDVDPGAVTDQKIISAARDWGFQQLDDAVKRMVVGDIPDVDKDARKVPDGIEHLYRDITVDKVASFSRTMKEGMVIEPNIGPRGTLPNITSMLDKDGKPLKWTDFAKTVDLDDPFFKSINVSIRANADFTALPIFSVEGEVNYDEGTTHRSTPFSFTSSNDIAKFTSFIENNNHKIKYNYTVNYKGESKAFKSQVIETEDQALTINVGDTGVLQATVFAGDMNFDQITQALVSVHYEDGGNGVGPLDWQVVLDKDHKQQTIQKVIFAPRTQPFSYSVKYNMKDGKEYTVTGKKNPAAQIYVGDPFSGTKQISVRAVGDLNTDIQTIFVDLKYTDEMNKYTQSASFALNKANSFVDWNFPVIDEAAGKVTYSGSIQFADGSVQTIAEAPATKQTLLLGRAHDDSEFLTVTLVPDLLDWTKLKLVKVSLHYKDDANQVDAAKDYVLTKATTNPPTWSLRLQDKTKRTYSYKVSYFFVDGTSKATEVPNATDQTLVLEMQMAAVNG